MLGHTWHVVSGGTVLGGVAFVVTLLSLSALVAVQADEPVRD